MQYTIKLPIWGTTIKLLGTSNKCYEQGQFWPCFFILRLPTTPTYLINIDHLKTTNTDKLIPSRTLSIFWGYYFHIWNHIQYAKPAYLSLLVEFEIVDADHKLLPRDGVSAGEIVLDEGFNPDKVKIPKRFLEVATWKGQTDPE